jgi:hypothetical protein
MEVNPLQRRFCRLRLWLVSACLTALASMSFEPAALAAPKDAEAEKLYSKAMDEDYLNVQLDAAIDKLEKALKACGKDKCSKAVVAKLYVGLGTIYGAAKEDKAKAKANYVKAAQADNTVESIDYMTPELRDMLDQAKKDAAPAGDDDDDDTGPQPQPTDDDDDDTGPKPDDDDDDDTAPAGDLDYTSPEEALIDTPLPLFIEVPDDLDAASVNVRYRPFGSPKWLKASMKKMKGGFGGTVPCKELNTTGDLKLYIIVKDKDGDPVATAGTRKQPLSITIKNQIKGEQPALPGQKPPKSCTKSGNCPPDFPGCDGGGNNTGGGDKGWGEACKDSDECRSEFTCLNNTCEEKPIGADDDDDDDDDDDGPADEYPKNFIYAGVQFDLLAISGAENVCGASESAGQYQQELDNYFCFNPDDGGEFLGKPQKGAFNEIEGGMGFAGARILLGYDRIIVAGFGLGLRVGYAFGGSPSVGDAEDRFNDCKQAIESDGDPNTDPEDWCREPLANDFIPWHAELRAEYFFPDPAGFANGIVRPYAFVGGGIGQVNAGVTVAVCDRVDDNGLPITDGGGGKCDDATEKREDIEAYQVTGLNFIDLGVGAVFSFHDYVGVNVELKAMFMVPTFGFVFAPSVSPVFHF